MTIPVLWTPNADECIPGTWTDLLAKLLGYVDVDLTGVIVLAGDTPPAVDDRDKYWLKVNTASPDTNGVYVYDAAARGSGGWVSYVHTRANEVRIYKGTTTDLETYDGGEAGAVSDWNGPMWQVDTDFQFKVPIGCGTNSVTYDSNPATTLAIGNTGGVERVALSEDELPAITVKFTDEQFGKWKAELNSGDDDEGLVGQLAGPAGPYEPESDPLGDGKSHTNMMPYRAVYFIKRTSRKGYYIPG